MNAYSLTSALRDPDEGVRSYAAESLGQLGERGVMPELSALLAVEQDAGVRASTLRALYQLGDEAALALLLDGVEGVDDQTAAVILNMAAWVTRPEHAALLRSRLEALRVSLVFEAPGFSPSFAVPGGHLRRRPPCPRRAANTSLSLTGLVA